jgi:hypothetical protein
MCIIVGNIIWVFVNVADYVKSRHRTLEAAHIRQKMAQKLKDEHKSMEMRTKAINVQGSSEGSEAKDKGPNWDKGEEGTGRPCDN